MARSASQVVAREANTPVRRYCHAKPGCRNRRGVVRRRHCVAHDAEPVELISGRLPGRLQDMAGEGVAGSMARAPVAVLDPVPVHCEYAAPRGPGIGRHGDTGDKVGSRRLSSSLTTGALWI